KSSIGFSLPFFYAIGAGSLVLFFTFLIVFSIQKVGIYFNAITKTEKVMRVMAGLLFVITGMYYILIYLKVL
ncbi:MAG: sulfite exporter TauE/SafE family protein, partial [Bacteroidetes bacterium]|nr:sulfite exporter TauE/SafE family protein [Bacteroidota bacterium]